LFVLPLFGFFFCTLHKDIYRERIGRQGGTGFLMV
jgi:hypothetical protein